MDFQHRGETNQASSASRPVTAQLRATSGHGAGLTESADPRAEVRVPFRLSLVWRVLAGTIVVVVCLSTLGQILRFGFDKKSAWGFVEKFWLDAEMNFPTYFSSMLLLMIGVSAWAVGASTRQQGDRWWKQLYFIAAIFAALSADEVAAMRERLNDVSEKLGILQGFFRFHWVIGGMVVVALLTYWFRPFVFSLPSAIRNRVIVAAAFYLSGAIGLEMVGAKLFDSYGESFTSIPYAVCATFEETFEMIGALICLDAFLRYLWEHAGISKFSFTAPTE